MSDPVQRYEANEELVANWYAELIDLATTDEQRETITRVTDEVLEELNTRTD